MINIRVLFIFLDGVGLGVDDPNINPFARLEMPFLQSLLGGNKLLAKSAPYVGERATLLPLDAALGVNGLPQSATGQAVLLTGINVPQEIGEHYGPKPNPAVAKYLLNGNLFSQVIKPKKLRLCSMLIRRAISTEWIPANGFTRQFHWQLHQQDYVYSTRMIIMRAAPYLPTLSATAGAACWAFPMRQFMNRIEAGNKLSELANQYDFSFFEYWASDYAGHKQDMNWAIEQFKIFDDVLSGLCDQWDDKNGLILITSDHGNMEDLSTRRHTDTKVPGLLIGSSKARAAFASGLPSRTGVRLCSRHEQ